MTTSVTCSGCGATFEGRNSRARYCSERCKKRGQRKPAEPAGAKPGRTPAPSTSGDFVEATRRELIRIGRLDSMLGQQALVIARRMGSTDETGGAVASLSREHSRLMAAAALGSTPSDPVEVARAAREQQEREAREAGG